MARPKKTLQQKVQEEFPEFHDSVAGLSVPDLEKRLSEYAKRRNEIEEAKEALEEDSGIKALREELKNTFAPFTEGKKEVNVKSKYIIGLIREKGGRA